MRYKQYSNFKWNPFQLLHQPGNFPGLTYFALQQVGFIVHGSSKLLSDWMTHQTNIHYFSFHANQPHRKHPRSYYQPYSGRYSLLSVLFTFSLWITYNHQERAVPGRYKLVSMRILSPVLWKCLMHQEKNIANVAII